MKIRDITEATGLTFKGSPCTKDCSGHEAGYKWSRHRGGVTAMSRSPSFDKGAAIAASELHKPRQAQQVKPQKKRREIPPESTL